MVTSTSTPGSKLMLVWKKVIRKYLGACGILDTHDLLDDLGGGVEVDEALVHLQLVAIPGLGTLTARLSKQRVRKRIKNNAKNYLQSYGW